jgi:hypothetical protein
MVTDIMAVAMAIQYREWLLDFNVNCSPYPIPGFLIPKMIS